MFFGQYLVTNHLVSESQLIEGLILQLNSQQSLLSILHRMDVPSSTLLAIIEIQVNDECDILTAIDTCSLQINRRDMELAKRNQATSRRPIGEILVELKFITLAKLQEALMSFINDDYAKVTQTKNPKTKPASDTVPKQVVHAPPPKEEKQTVIFAEEFEAKANEKKEKSEMNAAATSVSATNTAVPNPAESSAAAVVDTITAMDEGLLDEYLNFFSSELKDEMLIHAEKWHKNDADSMKENLLNRFYTITGVTRFIGATRSESIANKIIVIIRNGQNGSENTSLLTASVKTAVTLLWQLRTGLAEENSENHACEQGSVEKFLAS